MPDTGHTGAPWIAAMYGKKRCGLATPGGPAFAFYQVPPDSGWEEFDTANVRRILACVNAAEVIDTGSLERAAAVTDPVQRLAALAFAAKSAALKVEAP